MSDERLEEEHLTPTPDTIDFSKVPREVKKDFMKAGEFRNGLEQLQKF